MSQCDRFCQPNPGSRRPIQESFRARGDFHLTVGSRAIAKGVALNATGFATDIDGNPRPQGAAWAIGAYQFPFSVLPVITAITANVNTIGARITWTTDEPSDSLAI